MSNDTEDTLAAELDDLKKQQASDQPADPVDVPTPTIGDEIVDKFISGDMDGFKELIHQQVVKTVSAEVNKK